MKYLILPWLCFPLWLAAQCLPTPLSHQAFIQHIAPIIAQENQAIYHLRQTILNSKRQPIDDKITNIAHDYGIAMTDQSSWDQLLMRVDQIPPKLILAQAILESGYGQSRFAQKACNLFGQQCFEVGCGLVPKFREKGRVHEVKRFASIEQSIRSYMKNLNTHPAYQAFRDKRASMRSHHQSLDATLLAKSLEKYAEIGTAYSQRLAKIIQTLPREIT